MSMKYVSFTRILYIIFKREGICEELERFWIGLFKTKTEAQMLQNLFNSL